MITFHDDISGRLRVRYSVSLKSATKLDKFAVHREKQNYHPAA